VLTRREFGQTLLAVPLAAAAPAQSPRRVPRYASRFNGVRVGAQTYSYRSFRDMTQPWSARHIDEVMGKVVDAMAQNHIDLAEFWIGLVEPPSPPGRGAANPAMRQTLSDWRRSRPLDVFERARRAFTAAGIEIYSCMYNFTDDLSDDELEFAFAVAKTLGTSIISANCSKSSIQRAAAAADRHQVYVAVHSTNASFTPEADGMAHEKNLIATLGHSPFVKVTLDTGHFTAYGGDSVAFIRQHHDRIANLHLKDRLRRAEAQNNQNTTEWGQGDAPLVQVLQFMRDQRYPFPACIEYEYAGKGTAIEEVQKCLDYAKDALIARG
jgi:sugar phosphate isomerase/epimerase